MNLIVSSILVALLYTGCTSSVTPVSQEKVTYFVYIVTCRKAPDCMIAVHERCGDSFKVVSEEDLKDRTHRKIVHCAIEEFDGERA